MKQGKGQGGLRPPKAEGVKGNTPDPNVSEGLKGNKKNKIAPGSASGTGKTGPATPL